MKYLFPSILLLFIVFFSSCDKVKTDITDLPAVRLELPTVTLNYRDIGDWSRLGTSSEAILDGNRSFNDPNLNNPAITNDGATLGRVLFYDKKLSLNNSVACGSCHRQEHGFADPKALSVGFEGRLTTRNSSTICNSAIASSMFWDSRQPSVKAMTLNPVQNHIEMGMEDLSFLETKLAKESYYAELFKKAYGDSKITKERISDAIAQFVCAIVSNRSKNDEALKTDFSNFTTMEKLGRQVFNSSKAQCSSCHNGTNFAAIQYYNEFLGGASGAANIGLDAIGTDNGVDKGQFKIPSLRNVAQTGPYMHDGRFKTLEEVVEHYNSGIQNHPFLDPRFKDGNGKPRRLNLSDIEKTALVTFLKTLTDNKFLTDERYSNPFKQ